MQGAAVEALNKIIAKGAVINYGGGGAADLGGRVTEFFNPLGGGS